MRGLLRRLGLPNDGAGIEPSMVTIHRKYIPRDGGSAEDLHLTASVPPDLPSARVLVNGRRVACGSVCELHQGDRLLVGHARVFRIVTPADGESVEHHTKLHEASAREAHKKGLPTPLEVALNEIEDDESMEFTRLRPVICRMLEDSEAGLGLRSLKRLQRTLQGEFRFRGAGEAAATDSFTDRKLYSRVKQFDADSNTKSKNFRGRASQ
ncbi:hypothetical protein Pmar_PMAR029016 [Perkinsus marinus ATCC 50983]|uniref:FHA domain-containing protein n=1 Tax=Perkinsus marinus (strain ATCC 50983 / TXsc) TaxID=423536 RepID=C5L6A0_PERM5|nr:hypothetical protein Pmar_PMAR029016 [Perkinsus marinus ATCC 50983]EER07727.1 hypothetical protein Pmar_PMAR029016 [Perkinsus marinus ATCC 50983]|eukprot:XP_002775911.1 hypothetical protein Pmar_PMAR029016 [Perkinsus marinus ATCC 50983]